MDSLSRRELWQMLDSLRAQGRYRGARHPYMDEAECCDRVAFLDMQRGLADRQRHPGRYWAQADLVASAGVEEIFRAHLGRA